MLDAAIGTMMTERGLAVPVADGSVLADFDTVLAAAVSELAGRVQATAFDAESGRRDVVPDAPAVGTKLRWNAPKLIAAANEKMPGANVRALHVLAPAPAEPAPPPTAPSAPVQRPDPPEGYREALAAHRAIWSTPPSPPAPRARRPPNGSSAAGSGSRRRTSPTAASATVPVGGVRDGLP
ncbi:hypothetical protein ACIF6K_25630 [Streptomyces sp. NPDC085942]|uniref:hypothetical protein n=1 Tax=Streptomyces sp. NPDC085942 TaxID=3365743 RepID=UPI0037D7DB33